VSRKGPFVQHAGFARRRRRRVDRSKLSSRNIPMTTSSRATLFFFSILALQLILGVMVTIGLFHSGFWRTAVLEICKFAVVLPQSFRVPARLA